MHRFQPFDGVNLAVPFEGLPIGDFQLDAEAEAAVVAFMKTLSDGYSR